MDAIRADLAASVPDAAPHPGRRRLGQDGRGGLRPGAGRARPAARPRCWRRPTCWRASWPRPSGDLLADAGVPVTLLDGLAERRGTPLGAGGHRHRARPRSSWAPMRCSRRAVAFARLELVVVDEQHRFGVAQREALAAKGAAPARPAHDRHAHPPHAGPGPLRRPRRLGPARRAPAGRAGTRTGIRRPDDLAGTWGRVRAEAAAGHRTFVVVPAHRPAGLGRGPRHRPGRRRGQPPSLPAEVACRGDGRRGGGRAAARAAGAAARRPRPRAAARRRAGRGDGALPRRRSWTCSWARPSWRSAWTCRRRR